MGLTLVDPTAQNTAGPFEPAPRPVTLAGARAALLANGKTHGEFLLGRLADALKEQYGLGQVRLWTKPHPSGPPTPEQMTEILAFADVVISAVGDCGSCSSCSVFDGMTFERAGIPSAILVSKPFLPTTAAIARLNGAEEFRVAAIAHPVTSKSEPDLAQAAAGLVDEIADILINGHRRHEDNARSAGGTSRPATMDEVLTVIQPFRDALGNDGADILVRGVDDAAVRIELVTTDAACADCIMPASAISAMVRSALEDHFSPRIDVLLVDSREPASP